PLSTELCHEGIILPPVRLVVGGGAQEEILRLVCANSRTPAERRGDLAAQIAANETGIRRFLALIERYGLTEFRRRTRENIAYAAAAVRRALTALPPGTYHATDLLDDDGAGQHDIPIVVTVTIEGTVPPRSPRSGGSEIRSPLPPPRPGGPGGRVTFDFT